MHSLSAVVGVILLPLLAPVSYDSAPTAEVRPVVDDYFGTKVVDPYRWMEEPGSPALRNFLQAENAYTDRVFRTLSDERDRFLKRVKELSSPTPTATNIKRAGQFFFYRSTAHGRKAGGYG
jgi:prolyl oligopeptidase